MKRSFWLADAGTSVSQLWVEIENLNFYSTEVGKAPAAQVLKIKEFFNIQGGGRNKIENKCFILIHFRVFSERRNPGTFKK